jgi:hypothetical protein
MRVKRPRNADAEAIGKQFVSTGKSGWIDNGGGVVAEVNEIRRVTKALIDKVINLHDSLISRYFTVLKQTFVLSRTTTIYK